MADFAWTDEAKRRVVAAPGFDRATVMFLDGDRVLVRGRLVAEGDGVFRAADLPRVAMPATATYRIVRDDGEELASGRAIDLVSPRGWPGVTPSGTTVEIGGFSIGAD